MADSLTPEDLARALRDLQMWAMASAPVEESGLRTRLREHLGCEPTELPVVRREISPWERANLQVALDAYLSEQGRTHDYIGLTAQHGWSMGLAELAQKPQRGGGFVAFVGQGGPKEHMTVQVGERTIVCVTSGLFLVRDEVAVLAAVVRDAEPRGPEPGIVLEAIAEHRDVAENFLAEIARLMSVHNLYRGRVLEIVGSDWGGMKVEVRDLPKVPRDGIVLPDGRLERIERQVLTFAEEAERLRTAGRHIKRGLLLHGAPGTGKTLKGPHARLPAASHRRWS